MARTGTISFENVSVSVAQDLFEITPADDKPIKIMGVVITQISDVGDAQAEQLRVEIIRGHATSGSGGSGGTVVPDDPGDTLSCTAEVNNTTIASAGTPVVLWAEAFNIALGLDRWFPPGAEKKCSQAQSTLVVRLMGDPADAVTLSGTISVIEE